MPFLPVIPGAVMPHGEQTSHHHDDIAARMAVAMQDIAGSSGACDADDLIRAGFTTAEILEYAPDALALLTGAAAPPADQVRP